MDLASTNKVFNPVLWQQGADGRRIKVSTGEETGAKALVVTKATPLYLNISLDGVNLSEATPRYTINVEREAASDRTKRAKKAYCVIATGETRFYGCFVFKKGVIPPAAA